MNQHQHNIVQFEICHAQFTLKRCVRLHLAVIHGKRVHICDERGKYFTSKTVLMRHANSHK